MTSLFNNEMQIQRRTLLCSISLSLHHYNQLLHLTLLLTDSKYYPNPLLPYDQSYIFLFVWLTQFREDLDLAEPEVLLLLAFVLDVDELAGVAVPVVAEEHRSGLPVVALRQSLARINFSYRRTEQGLIFFLKRIFAKLYYLEFGAWFV